MLDPIAEHAGFLIFTIDADAKIIDANFAAEAFLERSLAQIKSQPLAKYLDDNSLLHDILGDLRPRSLFDVQINQGRLHGAVYDIHLLEGERDAFIIFANARPRTGGQDMRGTTSGVARLASGMASILAHEIRNPLSAIKGAAQLLEDSVDKNDLELLELIQEEANRIGRLALDFEEMAGASPPNIERTNIHAILDQTVRAARAGFATSTEFVEQYDPSLPEIPADADRLQRALTNLLKNGVEAMQSQPDSTNKLVITTRYRSGLRRGDRELPIELAVEDTGGGIDDALLEDIFKPFITSKNNGTGLGLSVVARTIDELGGIIEVDNTKTGARFRMMLPKWVE